MRIFYNPAFMLSLSPGQQDTTLAHEVMHVILEHTLRINGRRHRKWNWACDYAINTTLTECWFDALPSWLHNRKYAKKSAEWIYPRLPEPPEDVEWALADDVLPSGLSPQEAPELSRRIREITAGALQAAKAQGRVPGVVQELVNGILTPKVRWQDVMRRFAEACGPGDYSWDQPDEVLMQHGIVLPTLWSRHRLGDVVVVQDTSGSVSQSELQQCVSELSGILSDVEFERLFLLHVDAALTKVEELGPGDLPLSIRAAGRGGTSFDPAFRWVEVRIPTHSGHLFRFDSGH